MKENKLIWIALAWMLLANPISVSATMQEMQGMKMQQISSYQGTVYQPGATSVNYVPASSGDLNPFGSSSAHAQGPRKSPPGTGGGKDAPGVEGPIGDVVWPMTLLALAYIIIRGARGKKRTEHGEQYEK